MALENLLTAPSGRLVGKPQEQGYDEHSSKFSLSCETKVIKPVGERTTLSKVDAR
jgi:hypothetical protein